MGLIEIRNVDSPAKRQTSRLLQWLRLLAGLLVVWAVVFVAAPALQQWRPVAAVHDVIREKDIEATGLVYTEVEEFSDADSYMRATMKY